LQWLAQHTATRHAALAELALTALTLPPTHTPHPPSPPPPPWERGQGLVFLYFEQALGASATLEGLSVLVTVSFEVPLFLASRRLVTRCSPRALLAGACLAYSSRVLVYALLPAEKGWLVLLCEPLHGVTYSLGQLGSVHYVAALAGDGSQATAQGLADSLKAVGGIGANVFGGGIMDAAGPRALYGGASATVAVALAAYLLATCASPRSRAREVCEAPSAGERGRPPAPPRSESTIELVSAMARAEEHGCNSADDCSSAERESRAAV
jgi:hypothetical protein